MVVTIALGILLALFLLGCIPIILDNLGFILYFCAASLFVVIVFALYLVSILSHR